MEKANVYFTRTITPQKVIELYHRLGITLSGPVAVKVHSGEKGNQNFLRPAFMRPMIEEIHGTVVECNTAYDGERNDTGKHLRLMEAHGFSRLFQVNLMDAQGPDLILSYPQGKVIQKNYVGKDLAKYQSLLVLSHFKGHPMGGFGGALKQLSIGCASAAGKAYIHSAGVTDDPAIVWDHTAEQDAFCEAMADAAGSVVEMFAQKAAYINVMCNLSVDCDCCAVAEDPCMKDIGILASLDPVALDQACIDLIRQSKDPGRDHFMKRVESLHGIHTIEAAAKLGYGTREYELIETD